MPHSGVLKSLSDNSLRGGKGPGAISPAGQGVAPAPSYPRGEKE
jgi:hypothetical protein